MSDASSDDRIVYHFTYHVELRPDQDALDIARLFARHGPSILPSGNNIHTVSVMTQRRTDPKAEDGGA